MDLYFNDEIDPGVWNRLAGDHVFHRYEWRRVIERTYGLRPFFALAIEEDLFALYPSFQQGKYCLSMPFTYIAGYLGNCATLRERLARAVCEEGRLDCHRMLVPLGAGATKITAIADIGDLEHYRGTLSHKMRNQLKKSEEQGLEFLQTRDLDFFYPLYCRKMHEHGTPPHKRLFFQLILESFPAANIFATLSEGRAVAAMFCLDGLDAAGREQPTLHILWAASETDSGRVYANYFTYWRSIQTAAARGIHLVDLGTTRPESSQHAFKQKWKPLFYGVQESRPRGAALDDRLSARLLSALWRHSPGWFADTVGPQVRKYLA